MKEFLGVEGNLGEYKWQRVCFCLNSLVIQRPELGPGVIEPAGNLLELQLLRLFLP